MMEKQSEKATKSCRLAIDPARIKIVSVQTKAQVAAQGGRLLEEARRLQEELCHGWKELPNSFERWFSIDFPWFFMFFSRLFKVFHSFSISFSFAFPHFATCSGR